MPVKVYKGIKRQMRVCRGLTYHRVRLRLEGKLYLLGVVGKEASETWGFLQIVARRLLGDQELRPHTGISAVQWRTDMEKDSRFAVAVPLIAGFRSVPLRVKIIGSNIAGTCPKNGTVALWAWWARIRRGEGRDDDRAGVSWSLVVPGSTPRVDGSPTQPGEVVRGDVVRAGSIFYLVDRV
ncbi:hypothetical protein B0H13DRAFT_2285616 [Mycena leptocephala]|nr:hypothetical protein B0H13DRAFT_2285616 [Mycena leptocephala]